MKAKDEGPDITRQGGGVRDVQVGGQTDYAITAKTVGVESPVDEATQKKILENIKILEKTNNDLATTIESLKPDNLALFILSLMETMADVTHIIRNIAYKQQIDTIKVTDNIEAYGKSVLKIKKTGIIKFTPLHLAKFQEVKLTYKILVALKNNTARTATGTYDDPFIVSFEPNKYYAHIDILRRKLGEEVELSGERWKGTQPLSPLSEDNKLYQARKNSNRFFYIKINIDGDSLMGSKSHDLTNFRVIISEADLYIVGYCLENAVYKLKGTTVMIQSSPINLSFRGSYKELTHCADTIISNIKLADGWRSLNSAFENIAQDDNKKKIIATMVVLISESIRFRCIQNLVNQQLVSVTQSVTQKVAGKRVSSLSLPQILVGKNKESPSSAIQIAEMSTQCISNIINDLVDNWSKASKSLWGEEEETAKKVPSFKRYYLHLGGMQNEPLLYPKREGDTGKHAMQIMGLIMRNTALDKKDRR